MSKKGLGNPAAIAAVPIVSEQVGKAGKAAGQRADKINADTGNMMSWIMLAAFAAGIYTVWKITSPFREGAGAVGDVIDSGSNLGVTIIDGVSSAVQNLFTIDDYSGIGQVSNLTNPSYKPQGATINVTQAQSQASQLLSIFSSFGTLNENEKQQVYAIFLNKTPVDYQMLSSAFGTPLRNNISGKHTSSQLLGTKYNLKQWLDIELGSAGVNFLRTITHGVF